MSKLNRVLQILLCSTNSFYSNYSHTTHPFLEINYIFKMIIVGYTSLAFLGTADWIFSIMLLQINHFHLKFLKISSFWSYFLSSRKLRFANFTSGKLESSRSPSILPSCNRSWSSNVSFSTTRSLRNIKFKFNLIFLCQLTILFRLGLLKQRTLFSN